MLKKNYNKFHITAAISLFFALGSINLSCLSNYQTDKDLDAYIKKEQNKPKLKKNILSSVRFQIMPVKIGHFTSYLITKSDNSQMIWRLEAIKNGDIPYSMWFEHEFIKPTGKYLLRTLVMMDDAIISNVQKNPDKYDSYLSDYIKILQVQYWDNNINKVKAIEVNEINTYIPEFGTMSLLKLLKIINSKKIETRVGTFKCFLSNSHIDFLGATGDFKSCLDSQIPLNGIVEATDSKNQKYEILNYGINSSGIKYNYFN